MMEEEETNEVRENDERYSNVDEEGIEIDVSLRSTNDTDDDLQGADSIDLAEDHNMFEQVSLQDMEKTGEYMETGGMSRNSYGSAEDNFDSASGKTEQEFSLNSPSKFNNDQISQSPTPASPDSSSYAYGGYSTDSSPHRQRPRTSRTNVSPELLHLIDSAIMGKPESIDYLKKIVSGAKSFGKGDSVENIALLVVDSLLATMGGVESFEEDEENNPPSVMLNSRAAIVAAEIIPLLPFLGDSEGLMSIRTRMVKGLLAILTACTRNRAMCSSAGLLGVLLRSSDKIFSQETEQWDGLPLCNCIQYLAEHSLNVVDLHQWLQVITNTVTTKWSAQLMLSLEKAIGGAESTGPSCTFEFDGESSGLLGPGESRWPFSNGFAFATWIYIESFADTLNAATAAAAIAAAAAAKSGKSSAMSAAAAASALAGEGTAHMPRLFSFLSADNQGMEAYFHAQFLVVESGSGKGKKSSLHFTHAFKPQCWYFIGLEHSYKQGLIGKAESELKLYIDGSLYESRPFDFPRISKPLAFCCIGTNPPPTMAGLQRRRRQCPLFAEMGPVYIFREPLGLEKMERLAARGGDILPSFGNGAGLPWLASSDHMKSVAEESALLDSEIAGFLHLLYHPSLLSGRYCPDASPPGASGMLRRPAEVLGQVHIATRIRATEALWALAHGGPMSLLPLVVSKVHENSLEPQLGNLSLSLGTTSLAAPLFRIISLAIQHPGNNEEFCRTRGPEVLSRILNYLLQTLSSLDAAKHGVVNEELVAAIVSLCQSQRNNHALKVQLFSTLLLDLKMWSLCSYGIQKKLLSSLADMVFTESSVMRDANAIQMLLDSCRRCYWTIRENESMNTFSLNEKNRPVGEVNALVDELLVVIELLVVAAAHSSAIEDVRCLLGFMVDCPQPNQVARVLHLIYRLVVQPNASRAKTFAEAFLTCGGIETLLVLLQRESNIKDHNDEVFSSQEAKLHKDALQSTEENYSISEDKDFESESPKIVKKRETAAENNLMKSLGGISFSISADNARNNVYNVDNSDGIVVGIIVLLGALVISGHLRLETHTISDSSANVIGSLEGGVNMFDDKVSLLLFALQKAFQAAPKRLMTTNVYAALLGASINAPSTDEGLNFYDSGQRFEHIQLLLVLLRSLPYAPKALQIQALQDILFLTCSHSENRASLTQMDEWPEWILEILISNYERSDSKSLNPSLVGDIEDLVHNFLIIMLEYSMRQKDGWKDIEATIHCAEWLSMVGGSSTGDQRIRREESMPIFKRKLLGDLMDFAGRELQVQTQVIAAAAAGVASGGLSPKAARAEAENAAQLSLALVENAIVILMLVEDHLRLQSRLFSANRLPAGTPAPPSYVTPANSSSSTGIVGGDGGHKSLSDDSIGRGLSIDVLASMADSKGLISGSAMEKLTAAAAAEPYESVSCAFVSYGSCILDLADGWRFRSRLWYGVGHPQNQDSLSGGGGSGWESWDTTLEKDENGQWIELPLVNKSVAMLQALLLDESGLGGGLGIGGGSGTGMGGMAGLYQLLDSDQPFLCMLRMVLVSLREEDDGENHNLLMTTMNVDESSIEVLQRPLSNNSRISTRKPRSALLWSVLSPILNMPVSESRRQRVLVACSVLYSEVYHAIGKDKNPIRRLYIDAILPPFVAVLRRWRPLLSGIQELASADGSTLNPLLADDRTLAADTLPTEAALLMLSPGWAAAFASPPAAMSLAMIAAGAAGSETATAVPAPTPTELKRDSSFLERKSPKLQPFSSFRKPLESSGKSSPKDKVTAKVAALAAARDLERNAKIGSGRGLSAVAMATSVQRRNRSDNERVKRWNVSEAMGTAWNECLQSVDSKSVYGKDFNALSYKYIAVLVNSLALARNMQRSEIDRHTQVDLISRHRLRTGIRAWRKLIHYLIDMKCLFGPFSSHLCKTERVFWKLDFLESSSRMRRYLRRNYHGSDHLGAAADYEEHSEPKQDDTVTPSNASIVAAEAISMDEIKEDDEPESVGNSPIKAQEQNSETQSRLSGTGELPLRASAESNEPQVANHDHDFGRNSTAVAPGYVPSEHDEQILLELPASMVRPLRVLRGMYQVTTKRINFIVDKSESSALGDELDCNTENAVQERDQSWLISSLHQIYSRRYLLRRSALELFMVDRSNFFFDFGSTDGRRDAYKAIVQARPPYLNNIYLATQRPDQLLKRTQLMERWARWEISNFEYLMQLNTLAGRSYNDITQYPVFPWVLSDYSSNDLNLDDPSSYRDLSKPVGALSDDRLKKFQERYYSFNDPVIPKFHYGSHYSSAGTVLYYLTRVEPFTTLAIQLQGGKFDHADRMFLDIGGTWNGVLEDMSDVKELVPELFYLPEILTNENSIDFGTTQLGEKIGSVKLPPWAKNPIDFIHKHRMALESEYVSAHLHEWVDLIFGYKQRGKEAIQANNVFFYITYEGTVNIDKISDPVQQRATQDQIAYFGQTPSQLLTVPHIRRVPFADVLQLQTIFRNPNEVKPYVVPFPERCNLPASAIYASSDSVVIADINVPSAHIAQHKWQPNTPDGQGAPFLFEHGKPGANSAGSSFMRMFRTPAVSASEEWVFPQALAFPASGIRSSAVVSITCDGEVITGGHADNSIRLVSPDGAKTLETARAHFGPVTCLSLSPDSNYLVSGSRDSLVILWKIHRSSTSVSVNTAEPLNSSSSTPPSSNATSTAITDKNRRRRIEGPVHVLRGHLSEIVSCCASSDLGVVVSSCSNSSDVLVHSTRRGRLIRRISGVNANILCLSCEGVVIAWDKTVNSLITFTLNGTFIAKAELPSFSTLSCMEVSLDGVHVLIGLNMCSDNTVSDSKKIGVEDLAADESDETSDKSGAEIANPSIQFLDLHSLEVFHKMELKEGQDITTLALSKDNTNLLVSTADRQLIVFTDPSLSLKVVDQMLRLGWEGDGLSPLMK